MDLESVADELYGLPPSEFVGARGRHVAAARTAGEPALAKEIAALRRPTTAAWASNLLVRSAPEQVDALLRLGEGLRAAQEQLAGDQLRELTRQRNVLVAELARQARRLARDAGHPVGDAAQNEIETTLHAVLADPAAAAEWATGRLVKPLASHTGFPAATATGRPARKRHLSVVEDAEPAPSAAERRRAAARTRELTRARKEAQAADREARDREKALRRDESRRDKAASRLDKASARVAELAGELESAERAETEAREALAEAERALTAATRTARSARKAADEATAEVTRLEKGG